MHGSVATGLFTCIVQVHQPSANSRSLQPKFINVEISHGRSLCTTISFPLSRDWSDGLARPSRDMHSPSVIVTRT